MKKIALGIACLTAFAFFAAGCQRSGVESTSTTSTFAHLDPAQAAAQLSLVPGDTFEVRSSVFGSKFPDLFQTGSERHVRILFFDPRRSAVLQWSVAKERESAASKAARDAFFKEIKSHPGSLLPPPPVVFEEVTVSGTVSGINLQDSHTLFPPAYWTPGIVSVNGEKSGLWISEQSFEEISRTHVSTVNYNVLDESAERIFKNIFSIQNAINKLRSETVAMDGERDPFLAKADADPVAVPLAINGATVNVSAWRVKSWFGELFVLNNRANPLILKLTLNPLLGAQGASLGDAFGYEITRMNLPGR